MEIGAGPFAGCPEFLAASLADTPLTGLRTEQPEMEEAVATDTGGRSLRSIQPTAALHVGVTCCTRRSAGATTIAMVLPCPVRDLLVMWYRTGATSLQTQEGH